MLLDALFKHLVDGLLDLLEPFELGPTLLHGFQDLLKGVSCLDEGGSVGGRLLGDFELHGDGERKLGSWCLMGLEGL